MLELALFFKAVRIFRRARMVLMVHSTAPILLYFSSWCFLGLSGEQQAIDFVIIIIVVLGIG